MLDNAYWIFLDFNIKYEIIHHINKNLFWNKNINFLIYKYTAIIRSSRWKNVRNMSTIPHVHSFGHFLQRNLQIL